MSLIQATLLLFVIITAVGTVFLRDVLASIVVFAAYSLGMAILYGVYRAPDVALTEAAIGAGVTTILLLLTLARTVRPLSDATVESVHWPGLLAAAGLAGGLFYTLPALPAIGDPSAPAWANPDVTQYYIENAYADLHVENAVMAVLAAYRGFDTFGEAVVVFAAIVAAMLVLDREAIV